MRQAVFVYALTFLMACASSPLRSQIPGDVREAVHQLRVTQGPDVLSAIKSANTREDLIDLTHFSLGLWIRNEWIYPEESPLREFFVAHGVEHGDDMSGIVIEVLHAELNGRAWDLQELIAYFRSITPPVLDRQPQ